MNPTPLGYFPKRRLAPPDRLKARGVEEIGSVSLCLAEGPDGWMERWEHNAWGLFPDPARAWALVPEDDRHLFSLYAYALHPTEYLDGEARPLFVDVPEVAAIGPGFDLVGYDVVSRSGGAFFECSPLSCNLLAEEVETNRWCLLAGPEPAHELALSTHELRCEPGPYHVVQVWREGGR